MSNFTSTLPAWPAGHIILDTEAGAVLGALTAITDAWTDFSGGLVWTASTTNPVLGNGTIVTSYKQLGKTVKYKGIITAGSTTTFGSGFFQINYPVTPTSLANTNGGVTGEAWVLDNSASAMWSGNVHSASTSILRISVTNAAANGDIAAAAPMTWATSDRFSWYVEYEVP